MSLRWGSAKPTAPTKLQKRLQRLPAVQVIDWADFYLNTTGKMLLQHQRGDDQTAITEAEEAAVALLEAIRELKRRQ